MNNWKHSLWNENHFNQKFTLFHPVSSFIAASEPSTITTILALGRCLHWRITPVGRSTIFPFFVVARWTASTSAHTASSLFLVAICTAGNVYSNFAFLDHLYKDIEIKSWSTNKNDVITSSFIVKASTKSCLVWNSVYNQSPLVCHHLHFSW